MKGITNKLETIGIVATIIALLCAVGVARADTITVTRTADSGTGSLRAALARASQDDTIDATGVSGAIKLTSGELLVTNSVTIIGPGPAKLGINGNAASRVFHIGPGNTVTIAGLTITNGMATGVFRANAGGGIYNDGSELTVINCTICSNAAQFGGGIFNDGENYGDAELTILSSTISSNSAFNGGGGGGGIFNNGVNFSSALLTIATSTLSGNKARFGGGIANDGENSGDAELTIANSTLSGNKAFNGGGGGIFNNGMNFGSALLTITTSTLSGNKARFGGGIANDGENSGDAELTIANSTLSGNNANSGGAIFNGAKSNGWATVDIGNTILNRGSNGANILNFSGTVTSHGYNLSSESGGGFLTETGDQINTDPKLGPLEDYGGPTKTHVLLLGSPAIDQGQQDTIAALASDTDQRGESRPYDFLTIANATGGDGSDIGAFEAQCLLPDLTGAWSTAVQTCTINSHGHLSCRVKGKLSVRNIGIADAPTSLIRYYMSYDATFDEGDTLLKQVATGTVKPGRPKKCTLSAHLPLGVSGSGKFILAVIDADNTVDECNESNNVIVFGPLP